MSLILLLMLGCYSTAESNAINWVHNKSIARPVHSVWCERDRDSDGIVQCKIAIEHGRLFHYKLKCYNSNIKSFPNKEKCVEVLDE